jgi:hypothetical protein
MKPLAIFKPGKHIASSGVAVEFTQQDVESIAATYDPAISEAPLVIGHPESNNPAYGWVASLSFAGGLLKAIPKAVTEEFANWVNAGFYKKISASFYTPDNPNNPSPGNYYLRHVGFLGAQPPAVKGMPDPSFSELDIVIMIDFAESNLMLPASGDDFINKVRVYHQKLHQQGLFASFAEALDTINAMLSGTIPKLEQVRAIRAHHEQQRLTGRAISFSEAQYAISALSFCEHAGAVLNFQEPL